MDTPKVLVAGVDQLAAAEVGQNPGMDFSNLVELSQVLLRSQSKPGL